MAVNSRQRLLKKRPEMKVLYMSGYTNGILLEHAFRAEDCAFIEKPFSQEALSREVRPTLNLLQVPSCSDQTLQRRFVPQHQRRAVELDRPLLFEFAQSACHCLP